jgi:hypothetical protein
MAEATRLLPRSIVHLFFLDFYAAENPHIQRTTRAADTPSSLSDYFEQVREQHDDLEYADLVNEAVLDQKNSQYKLFFGGEIIGFMWSKNQQQRSIVLQCEDWSNYWDYAYQFNNTGLFGPGVKAVFSGGATNLFTDFLSSKGSAITGIVSSGKCNTFPKLKGLAAGIVRLIEAIGGSYFVGARGDGRPPKRYAGQNVFFSLAELRLHITHMITALENDDTSMKMMRRQGYSSLFERALGGMGGQTSIRKCINALTQIIFHETYGQPCPKYVVGLGGQVTGTVRKRLSEDPDTKFIVTNSDNAIATLTDIKTQLTAEWDLDAAAVRKFVTDIRNQLLAVRKTLFSTMVQIRSAALATAKGIFSTSSRATAIAAARMGSWSPKLPDARKKKITSKIDEALVQLERIATLTFSTTKNEDRAPARLIQHILRPDIWFGAPPRCNVLFPENYFQLDYRRMFLQEPTRFLLKTNDEFFGESFLFDKLYFAPQAGSVRKDQVRLRDMLRNDLLEHELFTGILPVFEKMGEFNIFASRDFRQKAPTKVGFAQRSANFIYFKHRFNSRQMRVSGRFNPYIACGFPGLIVDKYVDADTIKLHNELRAEAEASPQYNDGDLPPQEIGEILGTNFLGNFTQTSHVVSQKDQTGRTEIMCSYPRQPDESVEFLGTVDKEQKVRKRFGDDASRSTNIAAIHPPKIFSMGPNYGRITNVVEVTPQFFRSSRELPIYIARKKGAPKKPDTVPIGVQVTGRERNSDQVTQLAGDENRPVVFRAFQVDEEVPRYRREIVELPAEEYIRPGWYGDVWHSAKIGKAYEQFFSTGAITDAQQISDPDGASTGSSTEPAQDALAEANNPATQNAEEYDDDPRMLAPPIIALDENSTIQQAVEFLLLTYSYIKMNGLDVEEFIRSYTWRPIANMVDIFGTYDLTFSEGGHSVEQGTEGFHSRAFGPYDDLFGLVGPDLEDIVGIKRGSTVAQKGDTRKRKMQAVQKLVAALRFSRAILA